MYLGVIQGRTFMYHRPIFGAMLEKFLRIQDKGNNSQLKDFVLQ